MFSRDDYGFSKYQKTLKHTYNYDWLAMVIEELADALKYLQNEMDRKEMVICILEYALEQENPKDFIKDALAILRISGTGKEYYAHLDMVDYKKKLYDYIDDGDDE